MKPLLKVVRLSKSFGTLPVIKQVSFNIYPGEVVGLTGSTGSGKSVLMMLLAGLYAPNAGQIYFSNQRLQWPFNAQNLGIGVIHQKPTLADHFDVTTNIFLGNEIGTPTGMGLLRRLDRYSMNKEAVRLLDSIGVSIKSMHESVYNLSGEKRQMIAIARILTFNLKMVIIDEPTVSLSYPNQQKLLGLIQQWQKQGVSILFSSNNLDHIFAVTDRIITLHAGRIAADEPTDSTNRESVVKTILGSALNEKGLPTVWGFDSYNMIRETAEKISYHQMLLEKDLAAEGALNLQLTEQLAEQLRTVEKTNLALIDAQRRLLSEREGERKHLAREIHDQIIQDLLSINYELESIEGSKKKSVRQENLAEIRTAIRELVINLRHICGNLRPPTIDSLGLGAAIQSYAKNWTARTDIPAEVILDEGLGRLPELTELSIFRIIQESLNNVWKHAQADHVEIQLTHTTPRMLLITVRDDGMGWPQEFDLSKLPEQGHFGLTGISERVELLGGRLNLRRGETVGSVLSVEIPHPKVETIA